MCPYCIDVKLLMCHYLIFYRCKAVASLLSVPPIAVLVAVLGLLSFAMAHAEVHVLDTLWKEPGVLWLAIGMPTGTLTIIKTLLVMFTNYLWY